MEHRLRTPLSLEDIKKLHVGDIVFLSGTIYTARDKAHAQIRKRGSPVSLEGSALYHCGPLIVDNRALSAGPTTSGRMARYTHEILDLGVKAIIGKGGLPAEPFLGRGIYLAYPGGCGAAAARQLIVDKAHLENLGMAEAVWELKAHDLGPMIVAIDSYGGDLYGEVKRSVRGRLASAND